MKKQIVSGIPLLLLFLYAAGQPAQYPVYYRYNRLLAAQQAYPQLKGEHLTLSIKDLNIDTTSPDLSGKIIFTENSKAAIADHATRMALVVAGKGITGMYPPGILPRSNIHNASYLNLTPEINTLRQTETYIQLHAYGTAVENYYGLDAALYDQFCTTDTALVHVFSSGNTGMEKAVAGRYDGMSGWSNLTGSYKQAKNAIVAGATDSSGNIWNNSSRGPAYDGRIKPDLCVASESGTSTAAAVLAGTIMLMQELYQREFRSMPSSALIRSVLYTAASTDPAGISHKKGFGSLDAWNTLRILQQHQYHWGKVSGGKTALIPIRIPRSASVVRITLAWIDPPAKADSNTALVNDLDLACHRPTDDRWFSPEILSIVANPDSLAAAAKNGEDHSNNNECITIKDPGDTTLDVLIKGTRVATGEQAFYISYAYESRQMSEWLTPIVAQAYDSTGIYLSWSSGDTLPQTLSCEDSLGRITTLADNTIVNHFTWNSVNIRGTVRFHASNTLRTISSPWINIRPRLYVRDLIPCHDSLFVAWNENESRSGYRFSTYQQEQFIPLSSYAATRNDHAWIALTDALTRPLWLTDSDYPATAMRFSGQLSVDTSNSPCFTSQFTVTPIANGLEVKASLMASAYLDSIQLHRLHGNNWEQKTVFAADRPFIQYPDLQPRYGINTYRLVLFTKDRKRIFPDPAFGFSFGEKNTLLFPNPARAGSQISIHFKEAEKRILRLLSPDGKCLQSRMALSVSEKITLPPLPAGLYYWEISDGTGTKLVPIWVSE